MSQVLGDEGEIVQTYTGRDLEYSEYDNIDYDKIYMTNLSKNVTTF